MRYIIKGQRFMNIAIYLEGKKQPNTALLKESLNIR